MEPPWLGLDRIEIWGIWRPGPHFESFDVFLKPFLNYAHSASRCISSAGLAVHTMVEKTGLSGPDDLLPLLQGAAPTLVCTFEWRDFWEWTGLVCGYAAPHTVGCVLGHIPPKTIIKLFCDLCHNSPSVLGTKHLTVRGLSLHRPRSVGRRYLPLLTRSSLDREQPRPGAAPTGSSPDREQPRPGAAPTGSFAISEMLLRSLLALMTWPLSKLLRSLSLPIPPASKGSTTRTNSSFTI